MGENLDEMVHEDRRQQIKPVESDGELKPGEQYDQEATDRSEELDDQAGQTHMPESPLIDPMMVVQPMVANREQFATPDGKIMVRYTLHFFNRDGQIIAEPCMVNGKLQPTPVPLYFTMDTGRRTLQSISRLSPSPNGSGR